MRVRTRCRAPRRLKLFDPRGVVSGVYGTEMYSAAVDRRETDDERRRGNESASTLDGTVVDRQPKNGRSTGVRSHGI